MFPRIIEKMQGPQVRQAQEPGDVQHAGRRWEAWAGSTVLQAAAL